MRQRRNGMRCEIENTSNAAKWNAANLTVRLHSTDVGYTFGGERDSEKQIADYFLHGETLDAKDYSVDGCADDRGALAAAGGCTCAGEGGRVRDQGGCCKGGAAGEQRLGHGRRDRDQLRRVCRHAGGASEGLGRRAAECRQGR